MLVWIEAVWVEGYMIKQKLYLEFIINIDYIK